EEQDAIADKLATFNARMSGTLTPEDRARIGLRDTTEAFTYLFSPDVYQNAIDTPHMKEQLGEHYPLAQRIVAGYAGTYNPADDKNRLLVHTDLNAGNILYD